MHMFVCVCKRERTKERRERERTKERRERAREKERRERGRERENEYDNVLNVAFD